MLAPERHIRSRLKPPHDGQFVERGIHSATHSSTLPPASRTPRAETQAVRAPVSTTSVVTPMLQSVVPLSVPGSGVPFAPTCHSALVGNRLAELAHASCAWNHVMNCAGISPGRLTA